MEFIDYLIKPYQSYTSFQILLEVIAAFTGILSVYYATKKNIWVYPIGIISTAIYTYLLYQWGLYGDMMINGYYTAMSLYGFYQWGMQSSVESRQWSVINYCISFVLCFILIVVIYWFKFNSLVNIPIINWIDTLYTAVFLIAMLLMAQKHIENWWFWIIGNTLAIPVFFIKGYGITAFQYIVFLILAIKGLRDWEKENLTTK